MTVREHGGPAADIVIRDATADDLAAIVALLADDVLGSGRELISSPLPDEYVHAFCAMQAHPGICELVAERDGEVVGCLQLSLLPGLASRGAKRAIIEAVRVASHCRGQGIGQLLVTAAIDRAGSADCAVVQLMSDRRRTDAHRFYARLGFVASHEGMKLKLER